MLDHIDEKPTTASTSSRGSIEAEPPRFAVIDYDRPVRREAARLLSIVRNGGSVLTNRYVWTDANIEVLVDRFVKQPDVSGETFFTKLDGHLKGVEDDVRVLLAEIFVLQMLPITQFRKETKIRNIHRCCEMQREATRSRRGYWRLSTHLSSTVGPPMASVGSISYRC